MSCEQRDYDLNCKKKINIRAEKALDNLAAMDKVWEGKINCIGTK